MEEPNLWYLKDDTIETLDVRELPKQFYYICSTCDIVKGYVEQIEGGNC